MTGAAAVAGDDSILGVSGARGRGATGAHDSWWSSADELDLRAAAAAAAAAAMTTDGEAN